jgi:hypothetical protein
VEIRPLAAGKMKALLRLYPRSWRERYGREMEILLEQLPGEIGVGLDLLLGAAAAYATVVRGNRLLSAAGAYLHGLCVAVLLQAIAFVSFILIAQRSTSSTYIDFGNVRFGAYVRPSFLFYGSASLIQNLNLDWLPSAIILLTLVAGLALVLAAPRLMRTAR